MTNLYARKEEILKMFIVANSYKTMVINGKNYNTIKKVYSNGTWYRSLILSIPLLSTLTKQELEDKLVEKFGYLRDAQMEYFNIIKEIKDKNAEKYAIVDDLL